MRIDKRFVLGMACFLSAAASVWAGAPVRDHDITSDDYFTIGFMSECAMSPDGAAIVYAEQRWEPPAEKRNTDLWIVAVESREVTRLTFDSAGDGSPKWSADGRWIYFTSGRQRPGDDKPPHNGKTQVWRIRPDGSDEQPVTQVEDGVNGYDLSYDGRTLYYTVGKKQADEDPWKELREKFDKLEYGHGVVKYSQVWMLDLSSWRAEKIIDEKRVVNEFAVSPDQRRIAMLTTPTGELITNEGWSRVDVFDATSKKIFTLPDELWRKQAPSPYGWLVGLAWSADGRSLCFRCDFDGYPGEMFVARFADDKHVGTQKLTRPEEVYVSGRMAWLPGKNDLCFIADDHARSRVHCIRDIRDGKQGSFDILTPGDVSADTFDIARSGERIAVVTSGLDHPPDLFTYPASGRNPNSIRITRTNPQVDTWKLPQIQIVKWTNPDGTAVEGILELPPDHAPGSPLPLMVEIHGGPTAAARFQFQYNIYGRTLFPARGWALLTPNYRGSTGYGDKFLTDLIGRKNEVDVADILAGVDHLVQQGIADADKLAVMGWSNGGFLTNCIITHTTRFKAAGSGAGVFDAVTQWLAEDTPGHVVNFNQGFPWNKTESMQKESALYHVDKVKTPTLIHVGENDPRCPPAHSRGLFRALHHYLNVPCELVVYPGEGHGLTKYEHRKAKMEWDIKWFDHHVLGKSADVIPIDPKPATD